MLKRHLFYAVATLAFAIAVGAQETEPRDSRQHGRPAETDDHLEEESTWEFWLRGNGQLYENFFQAGEGAEQQDVTAILGEGGASVRLSRNVPLRAYVAGHAMRYDTELGSTSGIRTGLRLEGRPHMFDVYYEALNDRPTFDVGDEFDRADIRTLAADYAVRFGEWQLGVDGELQRQNFQVTVARDNEFTSLGASVRWRRWRIFSPEFGVRYGSREVDDSTLSYDQPEMYVQVRSSVTPNLYVSVRYRDRERDYTTDVPEATYFGRDDDRRQIATAVDYKMTDALSLNFYAAREDTDTTLAGRDFETMMWLLGVTWEF